MSASSSSVCDGDTPTNYLRIGTLNVGKKFTGKLPAIVSRMNDLGLDLVALQEIGGSVLQGKKFRSELSKHPYSFEYSPGPSNHKAGAGFLLSPSLVTRLSSHDVVYSKSHNQGDADFSGRIIGLKLKFPTGHQLLVISAYMPTALDGKGPSSKKVQDANQLYCEALQWSAGSKPVIVMGDLNETLTPQDRFPFNTHRRRSPASPILCLPQQGFTDVWRRSFSDAARQPGYTRRNRSGTSQSRVDYIFCSQDIRPAAIHRIRIDEKLQESDHRLLWMEIQLPLRIPPSSE